MKGLFVLTSEDQSIAEAENFRGEELIVLVVMDKNTLATNFDDALASVEKRAEEVRKNARRVNVPCRVLVEWGDKVEAVSNALLREQAQLINKN